MDKIEELKLFLKENGVKIHEVELKCKAVKNNYK